MRQQADRVVLPRTTTLPAPGPLDLLFLHDPSPDPGTQSPFIESTSSLIDRFLDPRTTYDSVNDRLWIVYSEADGDEATGDCGSLSKLHIAVSKDPATFPVQDVLDSLGTSHWWYITGPTVRSTAMPPLPTTGSYDLRFGSSGSEFKPYKNETVSNFPFEGPARLPTIAIDGTRASGRGVAVITPNEFEPKCDSSGGNSPLQPQLEQAILIVPLEHEFGGVPKSILDGDRPDETDIIMLQLGADTSLGETGRTEDFAEAAYAVQEPYEAYDNAVFLISGTSNRVDTTRKDAIRLKGLFYDAMDPGKEWTLQQRVSAPGVLEDMDINDDFTVDSAFAYHDGLGTATTPRPRTPDMTTLNWGPAAVPSIFHSAVLTEDTEGNPRIFAVHSVFPIDPSASDPEMGLPVWVVQWYVIDPDFTNFRATPAPSSSWNPTIVATGRIDSENGTGDRYHPVIVVNRQGQAFIEYTYSDGTPTGWPQIRRVRLNNSYTAVVGSEIPVQGGPATAYDPADMYFGYWADYADAQADPFNACAYWSTHTLVHRDQVIPPPTLTDERDVWLFHQAYDNSTSLCFQTPAMLDLTDDGEVDAYDMLEFTAMYDRRARRVDLNGDGVVDAIDMALYLDAYNAYTSK